MPQSSYFLIADITGYSGYLNESELEHAQGVLEGLLRSVVDSVETPFRVSNIQGDAVFVYAPAAQIPQAQLPLEDAEHFYVVFRDALDAMVRNTTCPCRACSNIGRLDLKLILHYGEHGEQRIGGRLELVGPEVVRVHRLLKNRVVEATGIKAYLLVTEAAVETMGLTALFDRMPRHTEHDEDMGAVLCRVHDLGPVWTEWRERNPVYVTADAGLWFPAYEIEVPVAPQTIWGYATDPAQRQRWNRFTSASVAKDAGGRVGLGTEYHCAHGGRMMVFAVRDWKPFDYLTFDTPLPFGIVGRTTIEFTPVDGGTRLALRSLPILPAGRFRRLAARLWMVAFRPLIRRDVATKSDRLQEIVAADLAGGRVARRADAPVRRERKTSAGNRWGGPGGKRAWSG